MAFKDDYEVQRNRITAIVKSLRGNATIEWDGTHTPNWIRFRVRDGDVTLLVSRGHKEASEIADMSDDALRRWIQALAGGLL